jgi:hypothetical protein
MLSPYFELFLFGQARHGCSRYLVSPVFIFLFAIWLFALPGLPPFKSCLNFPGCVGIASDQRLSFIQQAVATHASHGTIHQPAVRGIYGKNVEYSGAYDAAMHLDCVFIFRHGISRNPKTKYPDFNFPSSGSRHESIIK